MTADVAAQSARGRYLSIGKYEILSHIATGGMGVIYRALDTETGRDVALKILAPTLAANPVALERFRREARQGVKLRHENLVSIYELGEANEIYFLAQEFVEGIDLHEYINERGRLEPPEAQYLLTQAVRALDYLHRQQVVHRDIKPANFLLTRSGERTILKLTDLGLAREVNEQEFRVTQTGNTVGTIDYMAPEQARDSSYADIRSDIYSLGCTFYHMLTGQPPFPDGGLTERLYKHIEADPPDVREFNPEISAGLVRILTRMLAKKPTDRYQAPAEILNDLRRLDEGESEEEAALRAAAVQEETLRLKDEAVPPRKPGRPSTSGAATAPSGLPARPDGPILRPLPSARRSEASNGPAPNPEHARIAASQFVHAQQVIGVGNFDYAVHLLLSCCRLDPGNLIYRQALRNIEAKLAQRGGRRRWLGWFRNLSTKAKMKTALKAHDDLKVLAEGENLLAYNPGDVGTHLDMAAAADRLGYGHVALWILEHAWGQKLQTMALKRALARLYEKHGYYAQAATVWKIVLKKHPHDSEAREKASDLAAQDTIVRGRYQEMVDSRASPKAP